MRTKCCNQLYVLNTNYNDDKILPKDTRFTCSPSAKDLAAPGSTCLLLQIDCGSSGRNSSISKKNLNGKK